MCVCVCVCVCVAEIVAISAKNKVGIQELLQRVVGHMAQVHERVAHQLTQKVYNITRFKSQTQRIVHYFLRQASIPLSPLSLDLSLFSMLLFFSMSLYHTLTLSLSLSSHLPPSLFPLQGPKYFTKDTLTNRDERFFTAEIIRESVFYSYKVRAVLAGWLFICLLVCLCILIAVLHGW